MNEICDKCFEPTEYSEAYDSYFCPHCNIWQEDECDDTGCEFCSDRPHSPNED